MSQCITCQHILMDEQPRGKGVCWKETEGHRNLMDVLEVRKCRLYKLGVMHTVKSRSQRRMVFNEQGNVSLK